MEKTQTPGRVMFLDGQGELPMIGISTMWSSAEVYLQGAHVTNFRKHNEPPLTFMSQCSRFTPGQPIRGGIPVIFPWFGAREGSSAHGFARLWEWELHEATTVPDGGVSLRFSLPDTAENAMWPPFSANYVVTVTDTLTLELIITNCSPDQNFSFE